MKRTAKKCKRGHLKTPDNVYTKVDKKGYLQVNCKTCKQMKAKERSLRKADELKDYRISRGSTIEGHAVDIASKKLRWCRQQRLECDLDAPFLINLWKNQNGHCAISSYPMSLQKGEGRKFTSPSLDRIDPGAGYTKTNVRWVCDGVNMMKGTLSDEDLEIWCTRVVNGLRGQKTDYIPNLNTFSDLIDRLIIDVQKLAFWENMKRVEQGKENPDAELIAKADNLSRDCCEIRSVLKNELNKTLSEIMASKAYYPIPEVRTFRPAAERVSEILAEACFNSAMATFKKEFVEKMEEMLNK